MNLNNKFAPQLDKIAISIIRQFDEKVSDIPDIIKLTLGEPDFETPEHVKQAGIKAIQENYTHYTGMSGMDELRQKAANYVKEKYQLDYDANDEIIVTVGATEGIAASLTAILEPNDKVLIPTPNYPGYEPLIYLTKAQPVYIDTTSNGFVLSAEMLEEALKEHGPQVKAIILNYPSNPTGVTYTKKEVQAIANVLKQHEIFVLTDEVYSELVYEGEHVSIASVLKEQTILIQGLSKSHSMTGWRIGFVFAPKYFTTQIRKTHQYLVTATSTISQMAAINALSQGFNDPLEMKEEYRKRRDFVCQEMKAMGFEINKPNGAFYVFAKIPRNETSMDFCLRLAQENKLALIPGHAFGKAGEGYIRLSYAASMEKLEEAMKRLKDFMNK
ncbi:MAG: pyridoxal phosphate-dependent aminotransferase [Streptococcaceae bacterium]|jgi:aminotransferase|nr:pyridoxal phosphate-dependent aminotransferase [Streptococcaceae bacterium]